MVKNEDATYGNTVGPSKTFQNESRRVRKVPIVNSWQTINQESRRVQKPKDIYGQISLSNHNKPTILKDERVQKERQLHKGRQSHEAYAGTANQHVFSPKRKSDQRIAKFSSLVYQPDNSNQLNEGEVLSSSQGLTFWRDSNNQSPIIRKQVGIMKGLGPKKINQWI